MEVWSHNLQTVVAAMAVGRLGRCLQRHIIKGWQIFEKKSKSTQAVHIFLIRRTFPPHKNSQNYCHQTRFLG